MWVWLPLCCWDLTCKLFIRLHTIIVHQTSRLRLLVDKCKSRKNFIKHWYCIYTRFPYEKAKNNRPHFLQASFIWKFPSDHEDGAEGRAWLESRRGGLLHQVLKELRPKILTHYILIIPGLDLEGERGDTSPPLAKSPTPWVRSPASQPSAQAQTGLRGTRGPSPECQTGSVS